MFKILIWLLILLQFNFITIIADLSITTTNDKKKLKILIISPSIGWSHSQLQGTIADVLINEGGHEVVRYLF